MSGDTSADSRPLSAREYGRWTPEAEAYLAEAFAAGKGVATLAREMGVSRDTIKSKRERMRLAGLMPREERRSVNDDAGVRAEPQGRGEVPGGAHPGAELVAALFKQAFSDAFGGACAPSEAREARHFLLDTAGAWAQSRQAWLDVVGGDDATFLAEARRRHEAWLAKSGGEPVVPERRERVAGGALPFVLPPHSKFCSMTPEERATRDFNARRLHAAMASGMSCLKAAQQIGISHDRARRIARKYGFSEGLQSRERLRG